jgi:hypothetical protein
MGQVENLCILRSSIVATILLHQFKKPKPLAGDGKVARVAANRNREVHAQLSYYFIGFRFFQANK